MLKYLQKITKEAIIYAVLTLIWLIFLIMFFRFYKQEIVLVSYQLNYFQKSIVLLSYNFSKSLQFFGGYLLLVGCSIGTYNKLQLKHTPFKLQIKYLFLILVANGILFISIYSYIFIILMLVCWLLNHIIFMLKRLNKSETTIYEVGDVIDIIGPLKEIPNLESLESEFIANWKFKSEYDIQLAPYMEEQNYYVEIFIKNLKKNERNLN